VLLCAGSIVYVYRPYFKTYQGVKNDEPYKVLDLCAAPGGKSTLLNSALKPDDLLVANEIIKTRVPILTDNLTAGVRPTPLLPITTRKILAG
jgi:hypothetical protein